MSLLPDPARSLLPVGARPALALLSVPLLLTLGCSDGTPTTLSTGDGVEAPSIAAANPERTPDEGNGTTDAGGADTGSAPAGGGDGAGDGDGPTGGAGDGDGSGGTGDSGGAGDTDGSGDTDGTAGVTDTEGTDGSGDASGTDGAGGSDGSSGTGGTGGGSASSDAPLGCDAAPDALRERALALVNAARAEARECGSEPFAAAPAVSWSERLEQAAVVHSRDMAEYNFFSHTGSDGGTFDRRIDDTGYRWGSVGENIAAGQPTLADAIDGWIASPGHCRNLMSASFTEIGLACAEDDGSDYRRYWTNTLARPR